MAIPLGCKELYCCISSGKLPLMITVQQTLITFTSGEGKKSLEPHSKRT